MKPHAPSKCPKQNCNEAPHAKICLFFSVAAFLLSLWYCMPMLLEKEVRNALLRQTDGVGGIFLYLTIVGRATTTNAGDSVYKITKIIKQNFVLVKYFCIFS